MSVPTQLAPAAVKSGHTGPSQLRPAESAPVETPGRAARIRGRLTTPRLYALVAAGLVLVGLAAGTAAVAAVQDRSGLIQNVSGVSGPLSVDAQTLYRELADADATAATAFLSDGGESAVLRSRYLDDIAQASAALTVALQYAEDERDTESLRLVADRLPVYTGLVETARSYQRLGVPLGGAYLREASGLMQQTVLPEAAKLFESAQARVAAEQDAAARFPWAAALLGLVAVGALISAQVLVARRSRRILNPGLVAATLATVLALLWSVVALSASAGRLETGERDGSALVSLLANAGRASLQARANESLTLVARGGGAAFEKDFAGRMDELIGTDGRGGLFERAIAQAPVADRPLISQARDETIRWRELHQQVRVQDDGGDYDKAVELATATTEDALPAVFARVDGALTEALATANRRVDRQANSADGALRGLTAGLVLLTVGMVAAVVLGFRPRIEEYR
ncbi:hypothetical protein QLQ12_02235 [Actinoplanes sp. NEAU-A12]|uniref:Secreted protein n=1 Tax=Actinoplanes sandaracinus TaxID=3045177 RepID=A0ABT6WCJ4_9ACTN|nr:hypothetical protein [Actinoplanes sandaracinus]MDI6097418.1 hypothetical protein [Actinoplanes sandaracinus]